MVCITRLLQYYVYVMIRVQFSIFISVHELVTIFICILLAIFWSFCLLVESLCYILLSLCCFSNFLQCGLLQLLSLDPEHIIQNGRKTLSYKQKLIDEVLQQSYIIRLGNGLFGQCLVREFQLSFLFCHALIKIFFYSNIRGLSDFSYWIFFLKNIIVFSFSSEKVTEMCGTLDLSPLIYENEKSKLVNSFKILFVF